MAGGFLCPPRIHLRTERNRWPAAMGIEDGDHGRWQNRRSDKLTVAQLLQFGQEQIVGLELLLTKLGMLVDRAVRGEDQRQRVLDRLIQRSTSKRCIVRRGSRPRWNSGLRVSEPTSNAKTAGDYEEGSHCPYEGVAHALLRKSDSRLVCQAIIRVNRLRRGNRWYRPNRVCAPLPQSVQ